MSPNFEYYKIFYYVAKYKNITAAAKMLFLSQPTVSYSIQNLEKELQCTLFIRSKKGVTLTPEAKILYKHVSKACAHIFKAEEELHAVLNMSSGTLRIGASELALHRYLLPYLERFRHAYPNIKLTINTYPTREAISALKAGLIDFAVIVRSPYESYPELETTELTSFQDMVIAGPKYSFLQDKELHLADLMEYPLITIAQGTSTRKYLEQIFMEHDLILKPEIELTTSELIVPLVIRNLGIGIVPSRFASAALHEGNLYFLNMQEYIPPRKICLVHDKDHPLSATGQKFISLLGTDMFAGYEGRRPTKEQQDTD